MRVEISLWRADALRRGIDNEVMLVSVMWRGIRVNLLYRRPGAASARLVSVVTREAAALARKGSSSRASRASVIACSASLISLFTSRRAEPSWSFRYLRAQARAESLAERGPLPV